MVSPESVPAAPKRKKSKRSKKHSRSRREGKLKRRNVEVVACPSDDESPEKQSNVTCARPTVCASASEPDTNITTEKEKVEQKSSRQTFSTRILFDLDEEVVSTLDNEDTTQGDQTGAGMKNKMNEEKEAEMEYIGSDEKDDQKDNYDWIQAVVESQPKLPVSNFTQSE